MPTLVLFLFRFGRLLFYGHPAVAVENAALRLQLAAFQRKRKRPVLTALDRLFWIGLSRLWRRWRERQRNLNPSSNLPFSWLRHCHL